FNTINMKKIYFLVSLIIFTSFNLFNQVKNTVPKPKCTVKDLSVGDSYGSLVTTSIYVNFKIVFTTEKCSSNGQYNGYKFEIYKKLNGKYVITENISLFKGNQSELFDRVNKLLIQKVSELSNDADVGKCYPRSLNMANFNNLGVILSDKVSFYAPFEINEDCACGMPLEPIVIQLPFNEILPYLN
ncbi:MAG: hypothetical protein ACK5D5_10400, partial [Bacteroidota bacterium]